MRWLLLAVFVAGCASEGRPVRDWRLDADGGPQDLAVRLPISLIDKLPVGQAPFTLRTEIPLGPNERGGPLTLVFDSFFGLRKVSIDGWAAHDVGDTRVSEHRFVVPAERTRRTTLSVVVTARQGFRDVIFGVPAAPRIELGDRVQRGWLASFNRSFAIASMALCIIFTILFATRFVLDRRRRADLAFAVQAIAGVSTVGYMSFSIGPDWLTPLVCFAVLSLAVAYFVHLEFEDDAPPRWLPISYGAVIVIAMGTQWSNRLLRIDFALLVVVGVGWGVHLVRTLLSALRSSARRQDALILLVPLALASALNMASLFVGMFGQSTPLVASHLETFIIVVWAIAQALVVARQDVAKQRALEAAADQLRRDVAERSKQLADALARLTQAKAEALVRGVTVENKYRVVRPIGAGGMGAVHEVERIADGRRMALKTLRGRVDAEAMARFAREAQVAAELFHPNLVPVHDVGVTSGGNLFLVMEFIEDGSLEKERKRFGEFRWALPMLAQIAAGLEAMHARGIVHRDLKPANVLLQGGVPRIADFGLAVFRTDDAGIDFSETETLAAPGSPPLTRAGAIMGTPFYMAPELVAGAREARAAADVFAFGVMAYQMVGQAAPFDEPPLMARLAGKPLVPARPLRVDGIDAGHAALIERCLALDPAARPTASDLRDLA
jgi:serine/threonine-protein kinase